jgi:predicted TIM-barrel fold metal-dependent hydrolase
MIIDAHTHLGMDIFTSQEGSSEFLTRTKSYIEQLKEAGIDKAFTFTLKGLYGEAIEGNDELAMARDLYPEVILPWGTVYPRWPEARIRTEVHRCIRELGFLGIKLHPWSQGFSLASPGMDVIAEECIDLNVPVTFHDGTPVYSTALQVVNLARAYPKLKVLSGHAGLSEQWRDVIHPAKELPNYWVCVPSPTTQQGLQTLYDELGADKLLYGSDGGAFHPGTIHRALIQIRHLQAPDEDIETILSKNALNLVKYQS